MKYIIIKAICKFSDGSSKILRYDENNVSEENACNDIQQFKKQLKNKLNSSELGITISQISLVYAERDGRQ